MLIYYLISLINLMDKLFLKCNFLKLFLISIIFLDFHIQSLKLVSDNGCGDLTALRSKNVIENFTYDQIWGYTWYEQSYQDAIQIGTNCLFFAYVNLKPGSKTHVMDMVYRLFLSHYKPP